MSTDETTYPDPPGEPGEQGQLDLWPRQHDLPPRWDGLPVEWDSWTTTTGPGTFLCPPPRHPDRCDHCGTTAPKTLCIGRIWTDPTTAPPAISRGRLRNGRHLVAIISAFRCTYCHHDSVLDHTGMLWDLDPTDYTDTGSWNIQEPHE